MYFDHQIGDAIDVTWLDICTHFGAMTLDEMNDCGLVPVHTRGFFVGIEHRNGIEVMLLAGSRHVEDENDFVDITVLPTALITSINER